MDKLDSKLRKAVRQFWSTRNSQSVAQGSITGKKDSGERSAVTAGKHLDGFVTLCKDLMIATGLPEANIFWRNGKELPGYFRAEKSWDLLAVIEGELLAVLEFKAQVGPSFGNNFNNRSEEVLGNATDLWAAYREGAFAPSQRPWLGYVFLLEDCDRSNSPVKVSRPHFNVFPEFVGASYTKRYEILLTRLLRDRLYDAACLILSKRTEAASGKFVCPNEELSFFKLATLLTLRVSAFVKLRSS